jgi:ABC-type phosphate transport system auxiliary subunit
MNPAYQWPVNNKNKIYRRVLWAFYLDTDPVEITNIGAIMNDKDIQTILADLDVKVVRQEVKKLDYAATSALEEMSDTMQSKAISKLTAETKELKEKLTIVNEEVRALRNQLKVYEARDESLINADIKGGGIH